MSIGWNEMLCVFGNEYLEGDGFALDVARKLNIEYRHIRNPDELFWIEGPVTILDVVRGLDAPQLIATSQLKKRGVLTAHDFDVASVLTLKEKLDLGCVRIIGIPQTGDAEHIAHEVSQWINEQA
jgi:Ni,Fe-hydrogenase maturation factor